MKLRQPYEHLIAGKLRQLPAPDADASWQKMKHLLDNDEDTRGGGRRRPFGNGGWWRIGMLVVVLSASFWLYRENAVPSGQISKNHSPSSTLASKNTNTPEKNKTASIDQTTTLNSSSSSNTNDASVADASVSSANHSDANKRVTRTDVPNNAIVRAAETNEKPAVGRTANVNPAPAGDRVTSINKRSSSKLPTDREALVSTTARNGLGHSKSNGSSIAGGATVNDNSLHTKAPQTNGSKDDIVATIGARPNLKHKGSRGTSINNMTGDAARNNTTSGTSLFDSFSSTNNNGSMVDGTIGGSQTLSAQRASLLARITGLPVNDFSPVINTKSAADSLSDNADVSNLLNNDTKKAVAKAQREQAIAILDKKDKKFHLNLSNAFKPFSMRSDNDPWWAAGIAINGAVSVGAQNRFNYNMNAKSGTLTDYIPSPYLQYHVNDYVYFQTELNFVSPQYTPQLLLLRSVSDVNAAGSTGPVMTQQKSVYVQKMYYFNWPVSLHYSPVKNLFFSGGVQFSSFQSGLASVEEKKYETALGPDHASMVSNNVLKFKDDSIAAKIAPNEWRWQVGAEYYINRFSIGLRYNQSFKKAVNTTVVTGASPTVYRNEAMLFFIRYNLFESRNKKETDKN